MSRVLITGGSGFIGTNAVASALLRGHQVLNLDPSIPLFAPHERLRRPVDLLDRQGLAAAFAEFQPEVVIHLAAVTDCNPTFTLEQYTANTLGTDHLLQAVQFTRSIRRLIVTSTQFVCRPGHQPASDSDYSPHTVYGQSKIITEQKTRSADLHCPWAIIRPTNIWGPWLLRHLPFYRLMRRGLYIHPGTECVRTWGFVGTVIEQIFRLIELPDDVVDRRTVYVGDPPMKLLEIARAFSKGLGGRDVRVAPTWLLKATAQFGDLANKLRIPFPLHSARFQSMTEDYIVDMEPSYELVGHPAYTIEEGVAAVARWLQAYEADVSDWQPLSPGNRGGSPSTAPWPTQGSHAPHAAVPAAAT